MMQDHRDQSFDQGTGNACCSHGSAWTHLQVDQAADAASACTADAQPGPAQAAADGAAEPSNGQTKPAAAPAAPAGMQKKKEKKEKKQAAPVAPETTDDLFGKAMLQVTHPGCRGCSLTHDTQPLQSIHCSHTDTRVITMHPTAGCACSQC
jgi:hypothetical protein